MLHKPAEVENHVEIALKGQVQRPNYSRANMGLQLHLHGHLAIAVLGQNCLLP